MMKSFKQAGAELCQKELEVLLVTFYIIEDKFMWS